MKATALVILAFLFIDAHAGNPFPRAPERSITPGSFCRSPREYRYPERIPYCERDVSSWQKEAVFIAYRDLGYSLSGERNQYKIDHLIPLCAGGSNEASNLWPQYYTVYERTDPLEPLACEVLSKGKITQRELVALILEAKLDYSKVPRVMQHLRRLNR